MSSRPPTGYGSARPREKALSTNTNWTTELGATPSGDGDGDAPTNARVLRRRRGLPGGRAVVGGFLVAVAAVGVFAAYTDATAGPEQAWVVARTDVTVGQRLTAQDLALVPIDLPTSLQRRAYRNPDQVVGAVALSPLAPNELLHPSDIVEAGGLPAVPQEISFPIDSSRAVGGTLQPGERVDVLATYGTAQNAYTLPVVRRALVLRSGSTASGAIASDGSIVLTLGLDTSTDALAVAHAVSSGQVVVVRTTASSDAAAGPPGAYLPHPDARPGNADGEGGSEG